MIYPPVTKSWNCPACRSRVPLARAIQYETELGTIYQCPNCRIELVVNPRTDRIMLTPRMHDDLHDPRRV